MIGKVRVLLVFLLFLAGAGVSGLLWLQHHGETQATSLTNQICGDEVGNSGCGAVNQSQYSEIAGMPLGAIGLFFYLSLGMMLVLASVSSAETRHRAARLVFVLTGLALGIDLVLFGLQAFKIGEYCKLCLLTYAINFVALLLLLPARPKSPAAGAPAAVPAEDSRLLVAGWVLASAALAVGIAASEVVLHHRESARSVSILGLPSDFGQTPAALLAASDFGPRSVQAAEVATPSVSEQELQEKLRLAEEEKRKLQEILDDPQKLQEYYTQKAVKEYDAAPQVTSDLSSTPVLGKADAPIQVVEFSDVLCPHCRQLAQAFETYLPQSAGRVAVYFKNYPLEMSCNSRIKRDVHPGACLLALGLSCAQQQGKFEAFYKKVFEGPAPTNPQLKDVVALGSGVGLDAVALEACISSPETKARLDAEIEEAARGEVGGTPTLFINGRKLAGLNYFLQIIEKESARLGLQPAAPPPGSP